MINKFRNLPLNFRLMSIAVVAIVPMVILLLYVLWSLTAATNAYAGINVNVTTANKYAKDFKERIDYTMYLAVIGKKRISELDVGERTVNGIVTVNPYSYISALQDDCEDLYNMTTVESNKRQISSIKISLNSLKKHIRSLEDNIISGVSYDDNMNDLNNNVYMLTSIVQTGIQDYIYIETSNMEHIREKLDVKKKRLVLACEGITFIVVIVSACLALMAARSISVPIRKLCTMTSKVAEGDFTVRSNVDSADEVAVLTQNFNDMTTEIGRLVEDIKQNHENLRIIEIKLLQAQINPHFLYNTLDTIVWLAEAKKNEEVVDIVTYLSDFFRTTLSGGKDFISISDEKRQIESYLKIQQFRYRDTMQYKIQIDEEIYEYIIPKLLLQPLVENALGHGIRNKRGQGHILVTGKKDGEQIVFRVIDDGRGMKEEELERLRTCIKENKNTASENGGFGIVNVHQRIRSYYGDDCGISFESEFGKGTKATIVLHAKKSVPFS